MNECVTKTVKRAMSTAANNNRNACTNNTISQPVVTRTKMRPQASTQQGFIRGLCKPGVAIVDKAGRETASRLTTSTSCRNLRLSGDSESPRQEAARQEEVLCGAVAAYPC